MNDKKLIEKGVHVATLFDGSRSFMYYEINLDEEIRTIRDDGHYYAYYDLDILTDDLNEGYKVQFMHPSYLPYYCDSSNGLLDDIALKNVLEYVNK